MNHTEAVMLCRYVKAACPQQAFDDMTPDAWADLLADLRLVDCREAAKTICQRQPFCAPAEIRAEVRRLRAERITKAEHLFDPTGVTDYGAWLGHMRQRAGDGEFEGMERPELPQRDLRVIESTFRTVGDAPWKDEAVEAAMVRLRKARADYRGIPTTDTPLPEGDENT
jgi:hypothetical protein